MMLRGTVHGRRLQYLASRISKKRNRFAVLLILSVLLGATIATGALAFQDYTSLTIYVNNANVAAGASKHSAGFNTRTENDACREDNSGQDGVYYLDPNNDLYGNSGPIWTNCATGAWATVYSPNGYFTAYCFNAGTVTHRMTCEAWNYQP
jgi:hypothetical protein